MISRRHTGEATTNTTSQTSTLVGANLCLLIPKPKSLATATFHNALFDSSRYRTKRAASRLRGIGIKIFCRVPRRGRSSATHVPSSSEDLAGSSEAGSSWVAVAPRYRLAKEGPRRGHRGEGPCRGPVKRARKGRRTGTPTPACGCCFWCRYWAWRLDRGPSSATRSLRIQ